MSTSGEIPVDGVSVKGEKRPKIFFHHSGDLSGSSAETTYTSHSPATNIVTDPVGKKDTAEESTKPKPEPKRIVGFDGYKQDTGVKPDDKFSLITGAYQAQMAKRHRNEKKPNENLT